MDHELALRLVVAIESLEWCVGWGVIVLVLMFVFKKMG